MPPSILSTLTTPVSSEETPTSLMKEILSLLSATQSTLSVAESLTGGLLAASITSVPGVSSIFRAGIISYATEIKQSHLCVNPDLIACHGVIHRDVAEQMATGVRKSTASDWGVGTTGVAGPSKQDGKDVGTVYVGVSYKDGRVWQKGFRFDGDRQEIREKTVLEGLRMLRDAARVVQGEDVGESSTAL
ncbi:putative competence/damage-inducible protein CinA [Podospora fimiseda]|uniref:Competence/damage-inducible protein CinA n=1 Tax=Podospora fimiseda TaxID=252190 RepID=A0AAN6YNP3_9PEZI|nr:putative competence/damage-inducible protein CinA [Podospora fimiseda]